MSSPRSFEGFRHAILRRFERKSKAAEQLAFLIGEGPCPACEGTRWAGHARALSLGGRSIDELLRLDFEAFEAEVRPGSALRSALPTDAGVFLDQLHRLAGSFVGAGLGHLSPDRSLLEVSEGESRRLRLAAVFDGRHQGLCLLLDEPARGLHDQDVERLVETLRSLRGTHTLVLNEHRRRLAAAADQLVELGPGPGPQGGRVTHCGPVPKRWWRSEEAFSREALEVGDTCKRLRIEGVRVNNLDGVDVDLPLGRLVCLTGVSGSGKSSFVRGALVPALATALDASTGEFGVRRGQWRKVVGARSIQGLVALDQVASSANRRSTVATFLGLADPVRKYFASLPEAQRVGLKAADFGFNAGEGRCSECHGIGELEEHGRWAVCPSCGGTRLGPVALAVRDELGNLAQLFEVPICELMTKPSPALESALPLLKTIASLGVGHLSLGRRLDTVSGGELQRLRIGRELAAHDQGGLLFVLDEPAAGLHHDDVARLLAALDEIVGRGRNSVVVVEHNLDIVSAADWVIEFGPGAGPSGGRIVAFGPPAGVRKTDSATGRMMRASGVPTKSSKTRRANGKAPIGSAEDAAQVVRWLRRLLGDDVPPHPSSDEQRSLRPTIALSSTALAKIEVLEYGGLGRELVALLLDLDASRALTPTEFLTAWQAHPKARLHIHPLVHELYAWGTRIPQTVSTERRHILQSLGFEWHEHERVTELRATNTRFDLAAKASELARLTALQDATTLGGGFVELRLGAKVLAVLQTRLVDLQRGIVGPMKHTVLDFLGYDFRGQCPTCKGKREVVRFPSEFVLGDRKRAVDDLGFLHPEAAAVLKGVHRNIIVPFFKRMVNEALWPAKTPVSKLGVWETEVLEHGYWHRPGPGSFLKTPKSDPSEVASWLRWDGLYELIRENAARGAPKWQAGLTASTERVVCPSCAGSGRRAHAELLWLRKRSFASWMRSGNLGELHDAVLSLSPMTERARRRQARLVECLAAVAATEGSMCATPLRASLAGGLALARSIATNYTDMPLIEVP